jgi:hypothetical protein
MQKQRFLVEKTRRGVPYEPQPPGILSLPDMSETEVKLVELHINQTESLTLIELWYALRNS